MTSCAAELDPETPIHQLIDAGYRFVHPRDAAGNVVSVVGIRAHHNVVDIVRINGIDDVTAIRTAADDPDMFDPDISESDNALWQQTGWVNEVVGNLLALADDEYSPALDSVAKGCWVPTSQRSSAFLLAG